MSKISRISLSFLLLLSVAGCATLPTGPSVMVLPGTGKNFDQFQTDDLVCRNWAGQQVGMSSQQIANRNTATGGVVGTLLGAGLGAAIGLATGSPATGAAIGAGSGLLLGTTSGASTGQSYGYDTQNRYDIAYQQCMYAKGNQIPGVATRAQGSGSAPMPPPPGNQP
jgi:hypothetical protein